MAGDANSPVGQLENIHASVSELLGKRSQAIKTGGPFPEVSEIATKLDYSELLRYAHQYERGAVAYPVAAAVETVHSAVAVLREYAMYTKIKSELYNDGQAESAVDSDYRSSQKQYYSSMIKGNYVDGGGL